MSGALSSRRPSSSPVWRVRPDRDRWRRPVVHRRPHLRPRHDLRARSGCAPPPRWCRSKPCGAGRSMARTASARLTCAASTPPRHPFPPVLPRLDGRARTTQRPHRHQRERGRHAVRCGHPTSYPRSSAARSGDAPVDAIARPALPRRRADGPRVTTAGTCVPRSR